MAMLIDSSVRRVVDLSLTSQSLWKIIAPTQAALCVRIKDRFIFYIGKTDREFYRREFILKSSSLA